MLKMKKKKKMSKRKNERHLHYPTIPFKYDKKILSKSTDVRIYRDTILLTPGEFSDSLTRSPVNYTEEAISESAHNWEENYLNVDHSYEVQKRLGFIQNTYYKDGAVRGDLYIFPVTQAAKDTIALIDSGLINWLSVELTTEDFWNPDDNKRYAGNISYIGAAVVTSPACDSTRIIEDGPAPWRNR